MLNINYYLKLIKAELYFSVPSKAERTLGPYKGRKANHRKIMGYHLILEKSVCEHKATRGSTISLPPLFREKMTNKGNNWTNVELTELLRTELLRPESLRNGDELEFRLQVLVGQNSNRLRWIDSRLPNYTEKFLIPSRTMVSSTSLMTISLFS
jgi:hypothetical protein